MTRRDGERKNNTTSSKEYQTKRRESWLVRYLIQNCIESSCHRVIVVVGCVLLAALVIPGIVSAQDRPTIRALRTPAPVRIDGRLDDVAWQQATPVTGFIQRLPDEGRPARQQSDLWVAYDDDALYVGARLRDDEPARIVRRLTRRDVPADADRFSIFFDPHHDHLTGVEFRVSAAGVQKDAVIYNDVYQDDTWDAVWESEVGVDDSGWIVEMRIPFSQLRFPQADVLTWGINAQRIVHRSGEESWLSITPSNESGLASRMPHLEGLAAIPQARHLELLPYVTARSEHVAPVNSGNPFNDGARAFAGTGLDMKYGIASNLTLDATVNPDFGQVEVDPAVVNLSASETFFEEKRPFFTEGSQILSRFGKSGASEYLELLLLRAAAVLLAPHRSIAASTCRWAPRGHTDDDDHPWSGQTHGQDQARLDARGARRGHGPGILACRTA